MKHISTRLADADYQWLMACAEKTGSNVSAVLRSAIERARSDDELLGRLEELFGRQAKRIASLAADQVVRRIIELRQRRRD